MLTQIWPRIAGSPGKVVLTNPTDAELVEACLSGRREPFDTIVERPPPTGLSALFPFRRQS